MSVGGAENLWVSDLCGVWAESTDGGLRITQLTLLIKCMLKKYYYSYEQKRDREEKNVFVNYVNDWFLSWERLVLTLS